MTSITAQTRRRTLVRSSPLRQAAGDGMRPRAGRVLRPPAGAPRAGRSAAAPEASRGREASVRGPSYFFLTIMPPLPEEMLLAVIANWYVVDAVGGVKPTSVPGSYLTDMM